jgi:sterol O-acyltransferase
MVATEDIVPNILGNKNSSIFEMFLKIQMSITLVVLLEIFLLFESLPNALAELTLLGDREFYQDWWNATSVDELFGKWMKFSYNFYYRHAYLRMVRIHRMQATSAKILSNVLSMAMQELIMVSLHSLDLDS